MDERQRSVANQPRGASPGPGYIAVKIAQVVWLLIIIILVLLAIRVMFALIGANLDNEFASFIYTATEPFVLPFRGLLNVGEVQYGVSRLEFETLVAMVIYFLAGSVVSVTAKVLSR